MANRWTEKQFKAIRTNGCNILVAAAAGLRRRGLRQDQGAGGAAVRLYGAGALPHRRLPHHHLYQGGGGGNEAENP